ncbi:hydrogenase maturation protease [Myxococcota bacterium]
MGIQIVCLGNELAKDDGVGLQIGRVLGRLPLPSGVEVVLRAELGFELLDILNQACQVILVDAVCTGAPPGTCLVLEEAALAELAAPIVSSHGIDVAELIEVARRLSPQREIARVCCVGVEAESFAPYCCGLTQAVKAALPRAVELVLRLIGAPPALIELGRAQCESALTCSEKPAGTGGAVD